MKKAWISNLYSSKKSPRTNSQRLLLFYSVECGLKASYMKRNRIEAFNNICITDIKTHNINKLLDKLRAGQEKKLPDNILLDGKQKSRNCTPEEINQVWRYGACCATPTDQEIEKKLEEINDWICGELQE